MRRDKTQTIDGVRDRDMANLIILVTHHRSEVSFVCELDGFDAEAGPENAIERGWRAAALQMSQDASTRFFSSTPSNLARNDIANSTELEFAGLHVAFDLLAIFWPSALGHDYERIEPTCRVAFLDRVGDLVVIKQIG